MQSSGGKHLASDRLFANYVCGTQIQKIMNGR